VTDTIGWALGDPPRAMMFVPLAQVEPSIARIAHSFFPPRWIVRSSLDTAGARRHLEHVIRELDPSQPFIDVQSLDSLMMRPIGMQRFYLVVLTAFAAFAVLLAAVGVYASYSYAVASRTSEIGVRLALGAAPRQIMWSVVSRALLLGAAATAVGLAVTYLAVGIALVATVLLAALFPALRAARVDPLAAIRR
jgi:putative ABC transport system permease protein